MCEFAPIGPRAVQRDDGRDVLEVVGLQLPQQRPHGPAVELEHAERVAPREQRVRLGVVELEVFEHRAEAAVRLDVVEGVVDDRQVAQPQEVHLDEAERLARRLVELGDDRAVLLALHDRDDVDQRLADMMTPAACTPHWRFRFSMPSAVSKTFFASASVSMRARMSPASL